MKKTRTRIVWVALTLVALAGSARADGMIVPTRPELHVSGNWAVKYHHVEIVVRDQVASVSVDQEFVNTGGGMIEVEYFFPVPPDAAIDSMTLSVNGRDLAARLLKADEARKVYEDIVRRKKDPALLEYAGFGLYRTRAFPLEAGKPAKVLVHYTTVCKKDRDLVEVWYPLNTEKFSARPIEDVTVSVDIQASADIAAVYSPTHDLSVNRRGPRSVTATYKAVNTTPVSDFQVFYKAANEDVSATLLTSPGKDGQDGYFLLLASPGPRASSETVVAKDMVLVLDHSGSMSGEKLKQVKEAMRYILDNLNPDDRFNVICYNDSVETFFEKLAPATKDRLDQARDRLDRISAQGGTNIYDALATAMKMVNTSREIQSHVPGRPAYVIFLTDGLPTVGKTVEKEILDNTYNANNAIARLFAFGVGYDVNVRLLDQLVGRCNGRSDYVKPSEPIESKVSSFYAKIRNPVMTGLKLSLQEGDFQLKDMYPRELGDLFEGDQIVLAGRFDSRLSSRGTASSTPATLIIRGNYEGKERAFEYPVSFDKSQIGDTRYAFVEQLWAVRRVGWLLDQIQFHGENKEIVDELVRLSLQYGIMTPYTSFLADERLELHKAGEVHDRAMAAGAPMAMKEGAGGQMNAANRQMLNQAMRAPAAAKDGAMQLGVLDRDSYEAGRTVTLATVRQVGNQAVYRRANNLWIASNAASVDVKKDVAKVKAIDRFGEDYFALVRANSIAENQVLASQQAGEELVVQLRGQVYRIR